MTDQSGRTSPPSSLDPFLGEFLRRVIDLTDGYAPLSHGRAIAEALDWPPAFVDALFTSARTRGLLEPFRARGTRGRNRWRVSARGRAWIDSTDGTGDSASPG